MTMTNDTTDARVCMDCNLPMLPSEGGEETNDDND